MTDPKRAAALRYQRARERYMNVDARGTRLTVMARMADDYRSSLLDCVDAGFTTKAEVKRYLKELEK